MTRTQFTIRDWFWLTAIVAVAAIWFCDRNAIIAADKWHLNRAEKERDAAWEAYRVLADKVGVLEGK